LLRAAILPTQLGRVELELDLAEQRLQFVLPAAADDFLQRVDDGIGLGAKPKRRARLIEELIGKDERRPHILDFT
jgi:hypothetical protein